MGLPPAPCDGWLVVGGPPTIGGEASSQISLKPLHRYGQIFKNFSKFIRIARGLRPDGRILYGRHLKPI